MKVCQVYNQCLIEKNTNPFKLSKVISIFKKNIYLINKILTYIYTRDK